MTYKEMLDTLKGLHNQPAFRPEDLKRVKTVIAYWEGTKRQITWDIHFLGILQAILSDLKTLKKALSTGDSTDIIPDARKLLRRIHQNCKSSAKYIAQLPITSSDNLGVEKANAPKNISHDPARYEVVMPRTFWGAVTVHVFNHSEKFDPLRPLVDHFQPLMLEWFRHKESLYVASAPLYRMTLTRAQVRALWRYLEIEARRASLGLMACTKALDENYRRKKEKKLLKESTHSSLLACIENWAAQLADSLERQ